jgi:hypothetical protein
VSHVAVSVATIIIGTAPVRSLHGHRHERLVPQGRPGDTVGPGHSAVQELQRQVEPRPPGCLAVAGHGETQVQQVAG